MSRIGKKPILIPEGVGVEIKEQVVVKGPKGVITRAFPLEIKVEAKNNQIFVFPKASAAGSRGTKKTKALWGSTRAILANMVKGVRETFEKKLELEGLGFRASLEDDYLVLQIGFTHQVKVKKPEDINFLVEKSIITVSGCDKEKVSQIAAKIRKARPAEPYKGKGIKYQGEIIRRKVGKKVAATTK